MIDQRVTKNAFKWMGDTIILNNHHGLELLDQVMKAQKSVPDKLIMGTVDIDVYAE